MERLHRLSRVMPKVEMDSVKAFRKLGDRERGYRVLWEAQQYWSAMERFRTDRERNKKYAYGEQWDDVICVDGEEMREADYISYSEVRAEYNLTHDQLHNYVKYHGLQRKKMGKYTYILCAEIDALLRPPMLK